MSISNNQYIQFSYRLDWITDQIMKKELLREVSGIYLYFIRSSDEAILLPEREIDFVFAQFYATWQPAT